MGLKKLEGAYSPLFWNTVLRQSAGAAVLIWLLMAGIVLPAAAQTPVTLPPTADAYVQDGSSANTNYGTAANLVVKKQSGLNNRQAYLKFDLSSVSGSVSGVISSVVLRVYGKNAGAGYSGSDSVSPVADTTWTETG